MKLLGGLAALVAAGLAFLAAPVEADTGALPNGQAPIEDLAPTGPSVEERLAEIARRVQAVVTFPPIARARGLSGEALVEFRIGARGEAQSVRTRVSSGNLALDRAAERAVHDAQPLPRVVGVVTVPVRFQLIAED